MTQDMKINKKKILENGDPQLLGGKYEETLVAEKKRTKNIFFPPFMA